MRILITGGAGFLGSYLANQLYQRGVYVRVLDDLSSGDPTNLVQGINFNRGDVRDIPKLWSLLQGVDVVYHLAGRISVPASVLYPREYNDVNVGGTVALLEACRDVGVQRVVLASSAIVYGEQPTQPVCEDKVSRPTAPYAVSKLAAEHYLFNIGQISGFEAVALRLFNVYGPDHDVPPVHAPVIPQFLQQTLGGGSVVLFDDGSQTRDFVYVNDAVEAMISTAYAENVDQQIINVGSGHETSINELVEQISQITGKRANILYNREASGGISRLVADLRKAESLLGYKPQVQLSEGLQRLLQQDSTLDQAAIDLRQAVLVR